MVETADPAVAVSVQASTAFIQVMESNMRRGEDQSEYQHHSNETVLFDVAVECFAQHTTMISQIRNT